MPVQKGKSALQAKLGAKLDKAVKAHASDAPDYGQVRLPGGIRGGIAQLTDCKFGVYKTGDLKGEYFFRAAGMVIEPEFVQVDGAMQKVRGLYTSIMEPVCDSQKADGTPVSLDEHVASVMNEMKILGAEFTESPDGNELEAVAAALEQAKPYFRFSTSQGQVSEKYPTPRVFENWYGNRDLENYQLPTNNEGQDNTAPAAAPAKAPPAKTPAKAAPAAAPEAPAVDLDDLVAKADAQDGDAQDTLQAMAIEAGATAEEVANADNWAAVAGIIRLASGEGEDKLGEGAAEGGDAGDWVPKVGEVYAYQVIDPATGKPMVDKKTKRARKPVEVEIKKVNAKGRTVDLLNNVDRKTMYSGVSWDSLESAE